MHKLFDQKHLLSITTTSQTLQEPVTGFGWFISDWKMYKKNQTNSIACSLQEVYFCQVLVIGSINYVLLTRDKVCHGVRVMFLLFFKYLIVKILSAFRSLFRNDFHYSRTDCIIGMKIPFSN